jgi:hypothetical protein
MYAEYMTLVSAYSEHIDVGRWRRKEKEGNMYTNL